VLDQRKGVFWLVCVTLIWGTTFPLIKTLGEQLPSAAIVAVRFAFAALVLSPWLRKSDRKRLWHGSLLGVVLFASYATQTIGLRTVTSGRAAFVTALNVVFVPLALPFLGRQLRRIALFAAVLAVFGVALLSWDGGALRFSVGDIWVVICALTYALYVLMLEQFAPQHRALDLAAVQVTTVAAFGLGWLLLGHPAHSASALRHASAGNWLFLAYLGIVAVAIATLLQTHAQRTVPASVAAVVYALEPVFGAVASYIGRGETIRPIGYVGAALVLVAMVVSQVDREPGRPRQISVEEVSQQTRR
jgi:drug/metabolite transporter (DMT)-like permease